MQEIKIVRSTTNSLPMYATQGAAGLDLAANISAPIRIKPNARVAIPTGISIALPTGYEAQVRSRSGLAIKHGIACLNAPGTIDSDYRGEILVLLINHGQVEFEITHGMRIAQLIIAKYEHITWLQVSQLDDTKRSTDGFGSTGV